MGKLHELLAVEGDLKAAATRTLNDVKNTFAHPDLLTGKVRRYTPLEEGGELFADERVGVVTTAANELQNLANDFGRWVDAAIQKEVTNTSTGADIVIDGAVLVKGLPATALLNLESKLAQVRQVYSAIPTNDTAEQWTLDEQSDQWVSKLRTTYRTQKTMKSFTASPATEHHPAQVHVYNEDVRVGSWETTIYSGMMTPVQKQVCLTRIDKLIRAVKKARQRANDIEASKTKVSDVLFQYINGG